MPTLQSVAINILLEPDARMLARAEINNSRLREAFPDSFALDAEHRPHITLLQCFIAAENLETLCNAVGNVIANANVTSMELRAVRYGYTPGPGMGVAGIWADTTPGEGWASFLSASYRAVVERLPDLLPP